VTSSTSGGNDGESDGSPGSGGEAGPSDRMRERIPGSRLRVWLLMEANRLVVTAALLAGLFAAFVVLGALDPVGIRAAMGSADPIETAFQGLLTAIVTGVTIVVTINQLVLSQELGSVGDQRDRMAGAMAFRDDVEDVLDGATAPADPAAFLRALVEATRRRAEALRDEAADDERRDRIEVYVDGLAANARSVDDRLQGARFGTFAVVSAALDFDYSWRIHEGRRLRDAEAGSTAVDAAFDDVLAALGLFGPAREHVKTLYFQWELIDLSRAVLYAAIPALVVAAGMILYVDDPATIQGSTLGVDDLVWVVSAAVTVSLAPFALLTSYILRIATVAKRTLAMGPFVLRETNRTGDLDGGER